MSKGEWPGWDVEPGKAGAFESGSVLLCGSERVRVALKCGVRLKGPSARGPTRGGREGQGPDGRALLSLTNNLLSCLASERSSATNDHTHYYQSLSHHLTQLPNNPIASFSR